MLKDDANARAIVRPSSTRRMCNGSPSLRGVSAPETCRQVDTGRLPLAAGAGAWIRTMFDRAAHGNAQASLARAGPRELPDIRIIRLAPGDLHVARQLAADVLGARSVPRASLLRLLGDERSIVLAAVRDRTPVGCLVAYRFTTLAGESLVHLHELQVRAPDRATGIGRALLSSLQAVCRADGADAIWVQSRPENAPAHSLWLAAGGQPVAGRYEQFLFEPCCR